MQLESAIKNKPLIIELFSTIPELKILGDQHQIENNIYKSYSAIQGHTPLEEFLK